MPSGTSGRNKEIQIANSLNKYGLYSIVRHPLYLGNFFIYLGPFIFTANFYVIIIFVLLFYLYYERIMYAEEMFLSKKFGPEFNKWSSKTPAILPNIFLYRSTNSKLSIINIIFKEYAGICGIILFYIIIVSFRNYFSNINPILYILMYTNIL